MKSQFPITGTTLKRFTQAGTLLWLLDPVRGEATTHSLDTDLGHTQHGASDRQSSKFLDSISLIFATRKDGDTVSAAAMEEGAPEGTIIRVASNAGVSDETLRRVRGIVNMLNDIADRGLFPDAEIQILRKIIEVDMERIAHYLEKIRRHSQVIRHDIDWIVANPGYLDTNFEPHESRAFVQWIAGLRQLTMGGFDPAESQILAHIQWATKAKWAYSRFIEATFKTRGVPISPWVLNVYKLGRYAVASQVLVHFALENGSLFCPMLIEVLPAPPALNYQPASGENHLDAALRRSIGGDVGELTVRLARYWNVGDPEAHFLSKCPRKLTVHAEIQLLNFYVLHRERMPRKRFIGVSKKSCFLCYKLLQQHPSNFAVSACHQKLYLNWIPPPCKDSKIYQQYKRLTIELSKVMENATKHEIEQKLVIGARRQVPPDSTAGVSLPAALLQHEFYQFDTNTSQRVCSDVVFEQDDWLQQPDSLDSAQEDVCEVSAHKNDLASDSGSVTIEMMSPVITFHVKRADDERRQDIVTITELVDPIFERPTWELLCVILASDERFGVGFDHACEFLLINKNLRVGSDRQFTACLEYLRNAQSWNNEVSVLTYEELGDT